jgi:hypothetical protein
LKCWIRIRIRIKWNWIHFRVRGGGIQFGRLERKPGTQWTLWAHLSKDKICVGGVYRQCTATPDSRVRSLIVMWQPRIRITSRITLPPSTAKNPGTLLQFQLRKLNFAFTKASQRWKTLGLNFKLQNVFDPRIIYWLLISKGGRLRSR